MGCVVWIFCESVIGKGYQYNCIINYPRTLWNFMFHSDFDNVDSSKTVITVHYWLVRITWLGVYFRQRICDNYSMLLAFHIIFSYCVMYFRQCTCE